MKSFHLGIDIGGTFTDVTLLDDRGEILTYKTPSTPENFSMGVLNAINLITEDQQIDEKAFLGNVQRFGHGTTVATNAFLVGNGACTGLITTKGFGDTILLQRMMGMTAGLSRSELTDYTKRSLPDQLCPPGRIKEITERVDYKGEIIISLNEEEVRGAIKDLLAQGVEAIAVCFLWSFKNPQHELRVKEIIGELASHLYVTTSYELVPKLKEYERTATTVINSYLGPVISDYLKSLHTSLKEKGLETPIVLTESSGGVTSIEEARKKPVRLLESGPTGGVSASLQVADNLGHNNVITLDMGGTSCDVGLIVDGLPLKSSKSVVGKYHLMTSTIDIKSIGAGGGSIAWVEDGKYLRVGPKSAGASPGPVCYGQGGKEPTVCDADVVLGIINPDNFLGGKMGLDKELAEEAIKTKIAEPLGISVYKAADGIRRIVNNHMLDLLHTVTIEEGYDPRNFVLYAYGGAGATHAPSFALNLVNQVVIPVTSTVHCALGAISSDLHHTYEISKPMKTPPFFDNIAKYFDIESINDIFADLESKGEQTLKEEGVPNESRVHNRFIDLRYLRQTHELRVSIAGGEISDQDLVDAIKDFESKYEKKHGQEAAFGEAGLEIVTFILESTGKVDKPSIKKYEETSFDADGALKGHRDVYFDSEGEFVSTQILEGEKLGAGCKINGPAIIEYMGTTVLIEPTQQVTVDSYLNLQIKEAN